LDIADYCREIETYLCRKNDGHLIRVVGPSFSLVSAWAAQGVPLKIACAGIDRYFERYYRKGPRRRPVKIDFCEADVLDVFDEWRKALGVTQSAVESDHASADGDPPAVTGRQSLPAHLERVLLRLSSARSTNLLSMNRLAIDRSFHLGGQSKTDNFWTGKTDNLLRPRLVSSTSSLPLGASPSAASYASYEGHI